VSIVGTIIHGNGPNKDLLEGKPFSGRQLDSAQFPKGGCNVRE
jgi:hypothetical protein